LAQASVGEDIQQNARRQAPILHFSALYSLFSIDFRPI